MLTGKRPRSALTSDEIVGGGRDDNDTSESMPMILQRTPDRETKRQATMSSASVLSIRTSLDEDRGFHVSSRTHGAEESLPRFKVSSSSCSTYENYESIQISRNRMDDDIDQSFLESQSHFNPAVSPPQIDVDDFPLISPNRRKNDPRKIIRVDTSDTGRDRDLLNHEIMTLQHCDHFELKDNTLFFVNRENEAEMLLKLAGANQNRDTASQKKLVVIEQSVGSGKSTFVRHVQKLLHGRSLAPGEEPGWRNRFCKALYVHVCIDEQLEIFHKIESFLQGMTHIIKENLIRKLKTTLYRNQKPELLEKLGGATTFSEMNDILDRFDVDVLLHIDEYDKLMQAGNNDDRNLLKKWGISVGTSSNDTNTGLESSEICSQVVKMLLDSLIPICRKESRFLLTVLTTKRAVTLLHGAASSLKCNYIVLPPLRKQHVAQTLMQTAISITRNVNRTSDSCKRGDSHFLVRDVLQHTRSTLSSEP